MKKLHKYTSGQGPFFVLSESNTRPFKGQSLTEVIWQGMAVPGNKDIVKMNDHPMNNKSCQLLIQVLTQIM